MILSASHRCKKCWGWIYADINHNLDPDFKVDYHQLCGEWKRVKLEVWDWTAYKKIVVEEELLHYGCGSRDWETWVVTTDMVEKCRR
jgi:hypothetical protein